MVSKRKTKHPHSYNLFFKLNYESFRRAFPLMKYRDVRVILGKIWKQLPIERKNEYYPIENKIPPRKRVKSKREYKKSVPTKTMVTRSSSRLRESSSIASSDVISSEDNLAQPETGNVVAEKAIEETNHLVDACVKKPNSKPATDFRSKAQNVAEKSTEENSYSLGNLEIQVAEIMEAPNEVNSNEDLPSGPSTSRDVTRENTGIEPYINGPTPMNALVDVNLCMDYLDNFYYTMRNIVFPGLLGSREVMATVEREAIQKQIQQDWANREYIEVISGSIKKIADFLNSFDMSCRSRIETLNEKLTSLERKIEYLEARVTKGETLT